MSAPPLLSPAKKLASVGEKERWEKWRCAAVSFFLCSFLKIVFFLPLLSGCLLLRSVYSRPPSLRNDWASVIRGQALFSQFLVLTVSRGISVYTCKSRKSKQNYREESSTCPSLVTVSLSHRRGDDGPRGGSDRGNRKEGRLRGAAPKRPTTCLFSETVLGENSRKNRSQPLCRVATKEDFPTHKRGGWVRLKKNRAISVFLYFRLFLNVLEEGFSPPLLGLCLNGRMAGLQKSLREIPAIGYFPWEGVKRRGNRRGSEKRGAGRLIPTAGRPRCFHPSHCGVFPSRPRRCCCSETEAGIGSRYIRPESASSRIALWDLPPAPTAKNPGRVAAPACPRVEGD